MKEEKKGDVSPRHARVINEYIVKGTKKLGIGILKPHPRNSEIYGEETDVSDLVGLIAESKKIENPIVVNTDYTIISGYRRWLAAIKLGYTTVPCEIREYNSKEAEVEALINFNISREKTNEQRTREGMELEKIISSRSVERKKSTLKQNQPDMGISPISDDLLKKDEKGTTRDLVASIVKISSGTIFARAKKVVEKADEYKKKGKEEYSKLFLTLLNKSPSTAYQLISKGSVESLAKDVIRNFIYGNAPVRSLFPKKEPTHQEPGDDFILLSATIESIKTAVKKLSDPHVIENRKKTKMHREIELIIKDLQKFLATKPSKTPGEVEAEENR